MSTYIHNFGTRWVAGQTGITPSDAVAVVLFFGDFVNLGAADYRMKTSVGFYGIATFVVRVLVGCGFLKDVSCIIDAH